MITWRDPETFDRGVTSGPLGKPTDVHQGSVKQEPQFVARVYDGKDGCLFEMSTDEGHTHHRGRADSVEDGKIQCELVLGKWALDRVLIFGKRARLAAAEVLDLKRRHVDMCDTSIDKLQSAVQRQAYVQIDVAGDPLGTIAGSIHCRIYDAMGHGGWVVGRADTLRQAIDNALEAFKPHMEKK